MLLHDKPEATDIRFGHKVVSDWLAAQIETIKPPFRLAITGGLGTGKSTILQAALDQIEKKKGNKLAVAYVDVWKLDKESVRRSALVRIAKELLKDSALTEKLRESLYGTFSEASYIRPLRKVVDKTGAAISFGIFVGVFVVAYMVLSSLPGTGGEPWWWKAFVSAILAGFNLASKFLEKAFVHVQRTFNRAPMVGAEEFEEGLQQILDDSRLNEKQVVIVFDNIDRAAPESSRAILAGISAFFDHSSHARLRNILIVVPFDPSCLNLSTDGERPIIDDCEKMFDAIVPLPKLTIEDLSDFAYDNLKDALAGFSYGEETLRDLAYLVSFSPFRSPREIKHMVNQLFSRLDLAKTLESNVDGRLQTTSTLLPNGTVTHHPDALLKLLICEKIFPEFTEVVVNNGVDLRRAFDVNDESKHLRSDLISSDAEKVLSGFLNATSGIPKAPPPSAAAFLYMKGPDQVVSIPSGQLMSEALYMNDAAKLMAAVDQKVGQKISHEDIAAVIRYHRKKYTKNSQALKNGVRAVFSGLSNTPKLEKILVIEICEVLSLVPELLSELSPSTISKYTSDFLEVSAVQKVWRILDSEFKKISDPENLKSTRALEWASEYFNAVFGQPDGLKRSGLDSGKLPYELLLTDTVSKNLGENYPGVYCSPENTLESVKRYLSRTDETNSSKYELIVSNTLSSCLDFDGAEKIYSEVSTGWQGAADNWLKTAGGDEGSRLAHVAFFWPKNSVKGRAGFDQLKNWVGGRVGPFHQKANSKFGADVLDIALSFYSSGVKADGNFDNIIQHTLSQIDRAQIIELRKRFSASSQWIWTALLERAQQQLVSAIDRTVAFDVIIEDEARNLITAIANGFQSITNKEAFIDALLSSEKVLAEAKVISKAFNVVQGPSRAKFAKLLLKYGIDPDEIRTSMEFFATNPDEANSLMLAIAQSLNIEQQKTLTEAAISALSNSLAKWTTKEARIFQWLTLIPNEFLDVRLKDPIELGLDRGAINGQTDDVKSICTEVVLGMWEQDHGFSEKSYKILKKAASDTFSARIKATGERNGLKESLVENLVGKVADKIFD